jgi:hypothetical protein
MTGARGEGIGACTRQSAIIAGRASCSHYWGRTMSTAGSAKMTVRSSPGSRAGNRRNNDHHQVANLGEGSSPIIGSLPLPWLRRRLA